MDGWLILAAISAVVAMIALYIAIRGYYRHAIVVTSIAVIVAVFCVINHLEDENTTELNKMGFVSVKVAFSSTTVSLPSFGDKCRLRLVNTSDGWILDFPQDLSKPVTSASEVSKRPEVRKWCGAA